MPPKVDHPALVDLLRRAYSGERAAAFAYIGHAGSLRRRETEREAVRQIEEDEWELWSRSLALVRAEVLLQRESRRTELPCDRSLPSPESCSL